jgi:uncharacterized phage protein gp47/JayE
MAFTPKTLDQLYTDIASYLLANPNIPANSLSDGSVIKTLIESMALELDEQYFQMAQILDSFSIYSATGSNLDRRAAEYNITRLNPSYATVNVVVRNGQLVKTNLTADATAAATTLSVDSIDGFANPPFTIYVDSGKSNQEQVTVSSTSVSGSDFLLHLSSGILYDHVLGALVTDSTITAKTIASGTRISTNSTIGDPTVVYVTTQPGLIGQGQYESAPITAKAVNSGSTYRVEKETLTVFSGGTPFDGATVTNKEPAVGGTDGETDDQLRGRIISFIQGLSVGTKQKLKEGLIGVTDPDTGQKITSTGVIEDEENKEVLVYIDDGTGIIPTTVSFPATTLSAGITAGDGVISINNATDFPVAGYLLLTPDDDAFTEAVKYIDRAVTLDGTAVNNHANSADVFYVDKFLSSAEEGQNYCRTTYWPIERNSFRLWKESTSGVVEEILEGTDFYLNRGTGDVKIIGTGLSAGEKLYGKYNYYTGIVAEAFKVIEGDDNDPSTYPGLKSAGTKVSVEVPTIKQIPVTLTITLDNQSASSGLFDVIALQALSSVENYIQGLGINGNFILAEVIAIVMGIVGISDVTVQYPTGNITVLEDELPSAFDANGNTLITVQ